ncbi:VOC family protein [Micromonospora sp. WMMA1998]|uniref:VOC family protein n=1 Tax=Micromonospora sp. WMMA1998 TaxID=3015167 RepID=UPI00248CBD0B|nr:VOC family protein [Micromonospora sp. WMMA1998]WBC14934.1 VOC family protein [Micromonospora sp. WMMA1998]
MSHLDLVTLLVDDLDRTKAFYIDLLGFEEVPEFSRGSSFSWLRSKKRSASIALFNAAEKAGRPTVAHIPNESGGVMLGFEVEDADAVYQEWKARGDIPLRTDVFDMGKGRTFGSMDPSGNFIQVFDVYPHFREIQRRIGMD